MKDATRFLPFLKCRRLSFTQPNWAETFWRLANVKGHIPNRSETRSGSSFWIFEFGGNLFSSTCSFLNVKSIFVIRSISRVFWLAFDLQQCEMIYRFVLLTYKPHTVCIRFVVYVSLHLDRCWITVPWSSQALSLYFAKWLIKHRLI